MPYYDFINEKTNEVKTLFFHMNDKKEYVDEAGQKWTRLFCSPQASIDTNWNEDSSRDFVEKTRNKKGSFGDLTRKSQELSEKRKEKYGVDKIAQTYFDSYAAKRNGKRHNLERTRISDVDIEI